MTEDAVSIIPILKQIPFFSTFNDQDHQEIVKNIQYKLYPANYTIFKEGDPGDTMYIIRKGQVKVLKTNPISKEQDPLAILNPNDFFGEMALFTDNPRNASIVTTEETEVFTLNKNDLFTLIQSHPDMATRVNNEFLDRVKKNDQRQQELEK